MSAASSMPVRSAEAASACEPTPAGVGLFALAAAALLAVAGALGLLVVLHAQAPAAVRAGLGFVDVGWLALGVLASCGGYLAALAAARGAGAVVPAAVGLAMMAACAAVGVQAVQGVTWWRYPLPVRAPVVVWATPPLAATVPAASGAPAAAEPDAALGKTIYANSCSACHGGAGEGIDGVGPAMAGNPWVAERSVAQLVTFLQVGRTPADPESKMGRAMPARGGNAALTDKDLADLAAFLLTLEGAATPGAGAAVGAASVTPPRWLMTPPPPPAGPVLAAAYALPTAPTAIDGVTRRAFAPGDRDLVAGGLAVTAGVQALLGVALLLLGGAVLCGRVALAPVLTRGWLLLGAIGVAQLILWNVLH